MNAGAGRPDRILIIIVSVIACLVVAALAVVFTRGEPTELDAKTPAGVVQRYSTAFIEGDTPTADSYLTPSARASCRGYFEGGPPPARIVLISTDERESSALVRVSVVTSGSGGPFGPAEYETEHRFSLVKTGGTWKIDQAPYPLLSCTGPGTKR